VLRLATTLLLAAPLAAHALCTSDGVPPVATLVERFTSADCLACWRDRSGPAPPADALVLDWIVPGLKADGAALASAASDDAMERLDWLRRPTPTTSTLSVTSRREGSPVQLRLAHGDAFNDYVGTSMELEDAGDGVWLAWLMLVERIPAGAEGSPVARNVVRKVFRPEAWAKVGRGAGPLAETRSMQVPPWTRADRLRLVSVLQDGRGRIRAITRTECRE
jgi:hypothetical protein